MRTIACVLAPTTLCPLLWELQIQQRISVVAVPYLTLGVKAYRVTEAAGAARLTAPNSHARTSTPAAVGTEAMTDPILRDGHPN